MASEPGETTDIYHFPEFFDRLRSQGALSVRDAVESETEVDGIVYHHRGVQVPGYDANFVWEPEGGDGSGADGDADGSGGDDAASNAGPTFSLEVDTVGPRSAWAVFDATKAWDVYLVLFEGGAVVAWMTDDEFEAEEADSFPSKAAAILSGRFSFGTFFQFGPDWVERQDWGEESSAPAMVQRPDGRLVSPATKSGYFEHLEAVPVELRPADDREAEPHLGLVDVHVSIDDSAGGVIDY